MKAVSQHAPKRGLAFDDPVDPIEDIAPVAAAPSRAKRGRGKVGKSAISAVMACILAVGTLFAYAFAARDTHAPASESVNAAAAVPEAARAAAELGFVNRADDASRSMVRDGLSDEAAGELAREREGLLDRAAEEALQSETTLTAEERTRLMEADLQLVAAQADKLKKEAEEAAKRLEEARKAAAAKAASKKGGKSSAASTMSSQDLQNLTAKGGSMPIKQGFRVGAGFGKRGVWARYHTGQDFSAPIGTPVYAVAPGVVLSPTNGRWAGTNVVIQHKSGATLYAHLSRSTVRPGQTVSPGQVIGYVGNTGRSFGPHLHFEYYKNGTTPGDVYSASNPMTFLRSLGVR